MRSIMGAMDVVASLAVIGLCAAFALALCGGRGWSWPPFLVRGLHLIALLGLAVAATRFALTVAGWLRPGSQVNSYDFEIFYRSGQTARAAAPLYDLAGIRQDPGRIVVFRHAPIGAVLLSPLSWLPLRAALNLWRLLNVGLYLATLALLLRHFRVAPRAPLALGLATLWAISAPNRDSLASGQWDTLFLAAATAALVLLARRRDGWAGACLALPIAIKFYPTLLLLAPLLERRPRVIAGCALGGAALTSLGLLVAGLDNTRVFLTAVLPAVGGGTLYFENQTPYALIGRLLASELSGNGLDARYPEGLTTALARGVGLVVVLVSALVIRRGGGGTPASHLAMLVAATLLVIPTAWGHYVAWMLLPLAVLAVAIARGRLPWPAVAGFAVAAILLPFGTERDVWGPGPHDGSVRLVLSYKVYGVAALWAASALAAWQSQE